MRSRIRQRVVRLRDLHLLVGLVALVMAVVTGGLLELRGWLGGSFSLDAEADLAWPLWESSVNVPAIVSGGVLVLASVMWACIPKVHRGLRRLRVSTTVVALGFLAIAIDEVCALHERLGHNWYWWYLPFGLALGACAIQVIVVLQQLGFRRSAGFILAGGACWIVALGLEVAQFVGDEPVSGYVAYVFFEEALELLGSGLMALGGIGVLRSTHDQTHQGAPQASLATVH